MANEAGSAPHNPEQEINFIDISTRSHLEENLLPHFILHAQVPVPVLILMPHDGVLWLTLYTFSKKIEQRMFCSEVISFLLLYG